MNSVINTGAVHDGGHHPDGPIPLRRRATRILKASVQHYIPFEERFIPDHKELAATLEDLRSRGCVIVFTTGVWDLFHIGHGDYIQKGRDETVKLYPDAEHIIMVVGVDTDALTRERKGPQRPIVPEDERYKVLSHLRSADIITPQYELNQLYGIVKPHVLIVSTSTKDLPPDLGVACEHCEHLVNLPPQADTSTSARIRRLTLDGSLETLERIGAKLTKTVANALQEARDELGS
jgi:D-beta-D-heptose 7-phosphate kinase/D-beta-D-heptose 1-phosphate adenosyltransferase